MSLDIQERDDRVRGLISIGKERGYVLFDELNEVLPSVAHTAAEIDGPFSAFERNHIHVCEDDPAPSPAPGVHGLTERPESETREDAVLGEHAEHDEAAHLLGYASDPVREEAIIRMRFGLDDGTERTLEEVGRTFAITRERIRQIEGKVLRKLRHPLRSRHFRIFMQDSCGDSR